MASRGATGFLPRRLEQAREAAGISQAELERRVGAPPGSVSRYESGKATPEVDRLADLARTLGRKPVEFVDLAHLGSGLMRLRLEAGLLRDDVVTRAQQHPLGDAMTRNRYAALENGTSRRLTNADTTALAAALRTTEAAVRAAHEWTLLHHT